jgi:hypothetical protein
MFKCKLCNDEVFSLSKHLNQKHPEITHQEYYLKYIKPNLEDLKCPFCDKIRKFKNIYYGYFETCCTEECKKKLQYSRLKESFKDDAGRIEKRKQTCLKKYGVDNYFKVKEHIQNRKKNFAAQNKIIPGTDIKYNNCTTEELEQIYLRQTDTRQKDYKCPNCNKVRKFHSIARGYLSTCGNEECARKTKLKRRLKTNVKRYGVEVPIVKINISKKMIETKRENHTLNTSQPEEDLYKYLLSKYNKVERNYNKDPRYPFCCDFYIYSLDLFIELNLSWVHGYRSYLAKDKDCIVQLQEWQEKATTSRYYKNAIDVWTRTDVLKRQTAKAKDLNYLEVFCYENNNDIDEQIRRVMCGLSYAYDNVKLNQEFNQIKNMPGDYLASTHTNKIILTYQTHFFKRENDMWKDPILRRKLIENRIKYLFKPESKLTDRDLLRGFKISGIHYGYSHFSPFWFKAFIEEFKLNSIYDPCGGWGQRLLGACDKTYIYNDTDTNTASKCAKIADDFALTDKVFYNEDASKFTPKEDYDAVFTCPPYFNTEVYYGSNDSLSAYPKYTDWLNTWWRNLVKSSVKPNTKYFAFITNNKYKNDMSNIVKACGLSFIKEVHIGKNNISHLQFNKEITNKGESLMVFNNLATFSQHV